MKEMIRLHRRAIRDLNRYAPGRMAQMILCAVFESLSPSATVWLSARLINELATQCRTDVLWMWVSWTVGVTAMLGLIRVLLKRWEHAMDSLFNPMKNRIFNEKFFSMDYSDVADQEVRDKMTQISQQENWQGWGYNIATMNLQNCLKAVLGILGAVALTVSLFTSKVTGSQWTWLNSPLSALVILGVMALTIWISQRFYHKINQKVARLADEATFANRIATALFQMPRDAGRRLDVRTYGQEDAIKSLNFDKDVFSPGGGFDKLNRGPDGIMAAMAEALGAGFTGLVYLFSCLKAWAGAFSVGGVTQYVGAITTLSNNISLLVGSLDQMRNNTRFLRLTYDLMDTPNKMYQGSLTTEKRSDRQYEVEFRNVSFKYPGSENWALKNVSMKFKVGKRLAIVGENGSGKTTFIKLLCRLYDPQEGQILLNGIDIRKYNYRDYMDVFSIVFQDFQLISQTLGANVAGSSAYDEKKVREALTDAGFGDRLETMPDGLNTQLYKDFTENGVEVSGGEAQKIAIARALYKDAPFIILDEPTAALDPIAEAEIYSKFNDISGNKTAIYISHRLSSCKFCDEIAVFHEGTVIQQGSHDSLLADTLGKYHRLWIAQAQYYTENTP